MIAIHQRGHLEFVKLRVLLQPRNPLFNGVTKPGTDLKTIIGGTIGHHGNLLGWSW
jgi:hypothetical protein